MIPNNGYIDLINSYKIQQANMININCSNIQVNSLDVNKNVVTDNNKYLISEDKDTITSSYATINQSNRNFDIVFPQQITTNSDVIFYSITLDDLTNNKNVVTDTLTKKLISEDKDSFVNTSNQITWSQLGRQFTASLPQEIGISSNMILASLSTSDLRSNTDLIINELDNGSDLVVRRNSDSAQNGYAIKNVANNFVARSYASQNGGGSRIFLNHAIGLNSDKTILTNYMKVDGSSTNLGVISYPLLAGDKLLALNLNKELITQDMYNFVSGSNINITSLGNTYTINVISEPSFTKLYVDNMILDGNTISTSSGNLILNSSQIVIDNMILDGNTISTQSGNLIFNAMGNVIETTDTIKFNNIDSNNADFNITQIDNIVLSSLNTNNIEFAYKNSGTNNYTSSISRKSIGFSRFDLSFNVGLNTSLNSLIESFRISGASGSEGEIDFQKKVRINNGIFVDDMDSNKLLYINNTNNKLVEFTLNDNEVVTSSSGILTSVNPDTIISGSILNNKFNTLKIGNNTVLNTYNNAIGSIATGVRMSLTSEYFKIPNIYHKSFFISYYCKYVNANFTVGFAISTISLNTTVLQSGIWGVLSGGNVIENGVVVYTGPNIATNSNISYEIYTDNKYRILINDVVYFTSTNAINNNVYYTLAGDSSNVSSSFDIVISPSLNLNYVNMDYLYVSEIHNVQPFYSRVYNTNIGSSKTSITTTGSDLLIMDFGDGISNLNNIANITGFDDSGIMWSPVYSGVRSKKFLVQVNGCIDINFTPVTSLLPNNTLFHIFLCKNLSSNRLCVASCYLQTYVSFSLSVIVDLVTNDNIFVYMKCFQDIPANRSKEFHVASLSYTISNILN